MLKSPRLIFAAFALVLAGCTANVEPSEPGIPSACFDHPAKDFMFGKFTCNPDTADTCAFNARNEPTQLDQSGDPLAYYCTCSGASFYSCWGTESFARADPL